MSVRGREKTVKALQPSYISVVAQVALQALQAKILASRNPFAVYDYAEALDALIAILPPEAKQRLAYYLKLAEEGEGELDEETLREVDNIVESTMARCIRDPLAHPYANATRCLRSVKIELDTLLRIVFDVAHRAGLFVVEREVELGREA